MTYILSMNTATKLAAPMTAAQAKTLAAMKAAAQAQGASIQVETYRGQLWCEVGQPGATRAMLWVVGTDGTPVRDC